MECPQCKNPLSVENASVCEWCGNQLPIPEESFFSKIKRLYSNFIDKLITNKKLLFIIILSAILIGILCFKFIFFNTNSDIVRVEGIIPNTWEEQSAFDYLTQKVINSNEDFEALARKYSQDTLQEGYIGIKVNNGQLPYEFDIMASKMETNTISPVFLVRGSPFPPPPSGDGSNTYCMPYDCYVIMKLLKKNEGFYSLQFITRAIKLAIGQYYQGGIIVKLDENAEHGLIASKKDLGVYDWLTAKKECEELEINGYDDWQLPSKDEIDILYKSKDQIGGFTDDYYWSCTDIEATFAYNFTFGGGYAGKNDKINICPVRAVRSF